MTAIAQESQSLDPSAAIELFQLDATDVGGTVLNFTPSYGDDAPIVFGGVEYTPVDVKMTGLEVSGQAALPRPVLTLANTDGLIQAIVNTFGDLAGCKVIRIRTYARFLDNGAEPDPSAMVGPDIFVVDRKSSDTPEEISWELSANIDQEGATIGRIMTRNVCMWKYRLWKQSEGAFDYTHATCPYTGDAYFDDQNNPVTDPADDNPSRDIYCCRLRFGQDAVLPYGAFPGIPRRNR